MAGENKNELAIKATTQEYLSLLNDTARENGLRFDDYQKECVRNGIIVADEMIRTSKYSWNDFSKNNIESVFTKVAFFGLNAGAVPRECYFIIRNTQNPTTQEWYPVLEFGIEGAGNDRILKDYGEDVKRIKSYIVYKGDDFQNGYMNGFDWVLPKYTRTFQTSTPEKTVYLIEHHNGDIDVAYATLDDVKKSLMAHVKQNGASKELLDEMSTKKFEELIDPQGKYANYKIKKSRKVKEYGKWVEKSYETPLISPAWTDYQSRDNMVERKLKNHATRKYPKNFKNPFLLTQYEETFEDEKYERNNVVETTAEEHIENAQLEFDEKAGKEELQTPKGNPDAGEEFVVTTEQDYEYEEPQSNEFEVEEDVEITTKEEEPVQPEPTPQQEAPKTTTTTKKPDWLKK